MKKSYQYTKQELFDIYGGPEGLTKKRAEERIEEYGENVLEEKGKKSILRIFLEQFMDLLVVILIIASLISLASKNVESTIVIFVVLILNAVLGTVQYVKAEKSLDAIKNLSAPRAKVLRDGVKIEVESRKVVPGDILLLEAGDMIVADGRILENFSLQVNESALTGESANVDKSDADMEGEVALGDRVNMVHSGSMVTYGRATVLVTGTGMNTEMGKVVDLMNNTKEKRTPLQMSLDDFSKKLAIGIVIICVLVFGIRLYQREPLMDSLMFAVALAVAAIPEALSSIVTIVQAMGTRKMAAQQAIIKDLKAVESLGCVSVICSDKTGTLTQNKMTVTEVYLGDSLLTPEQMNAREALQKRFLYNAILNNDSSITDGKEIGDPTEVCLLTMADKAGLLADEVRGSHTRLEEIPFDSDRKLMSTKYALDDTTFIFTKGATDVLLERLRFIEMPDGVREITQEDRAQILRQNRMFSEQGLRVLAFAYKVCESDDRLCLENEQDYIFSGLAAMMDPPRQESMQAISDAIGAGIKPIMITGDHKVTATAIAKQIGIFKDGDLAVTGQELDAMSREELDGKLERISVYARVSPENKIQIVDAWQRKGCVAAMTGDGVNDAPALKQADIGIAMGQTGTEVSKDASAMILADDNFATIIKAVLNGRNVYRNIMNAILFLLSGNLAAILVVLFCSVMSLDTPFEPVHLLFINLLTDSLPALAIGMESTDKRLLKDRPRDPKEGILTKAFLMRLVTYGCCIAIAVQAAYYLGDLQNAKVASTMAFATLTLARLFHGFSCRSNRSIFSIRLRSNLWSVGAFVLGVCLLAGVMFVPFMRKLFSVEMLTLGQVGFIIILGFLPTAGVQLIRVMKEILGGKKR